MINGVGGQHAGYRLVAPRSETAAVHPAVPPRAHRSHRALRHAAHLLGFDGVNHTPAS